MKLATKILISGDKVMVPVSFGFFAKGSTKRYTTGFVEAAYLEDIGNDLVKIRYGTDIFTISKSQLV